MLEEWVADPKTLATFATHYKTGEPIPAALVQQMRRANEFGQGIEVTQQMVLARVSLSLHDREPGAIDQNTLWKQIQARYVEIPFIDGTARQASFPHIGQAGYASAYYTYMWSLVIGKDLFSRFEGRDLMQPGLARKYPRDCLSARQLPDRDRCGYRVSRSPIQCGRVGEVAKWRLKVTASIPAPPISPPRPPASV